MKHTVQEIAHLIGGELRGDGSSLLYGAAGLAEAKAGEISFVKSAQDPILEKLFNSTLATAVIVPINFKPTTNRTTISVKNPLSGFSKVLEIIAKEKKNFVPSIHPQSYVSPSAKLGKNVSVGPFCIIEEGAELGDNVRLGGQNFVGARSKIGDDTLIYPHVVVREDVVIGKNCIVHSGAVIGADGFGFFFEAGHHQKIPQVGSVLIEDDVEIGACSAIDRATTGSTIVRKGSKIDNLVQIAHNVEIGEYSLLAAQVGIAGSTRLGKAVVLGGQAGVADHINIAEKTQVGGQAGVIQDTRAGDVLWGTPAQPIQQELRSKLFIRRLSELYKDVKKIKEKVLDK